LPIPALSPNSRYPIEICIESKEGRFIDRKEFTGKKVADPTHYLNGEMRPED
jgi:hypothetical protein